MMSNWTAASSDCSRPANNYVRVNTVDLYTPNARFTPERLGYQVLTLFGKLGYSRNFNYMLIPVFVSTPNTLSDHQSASQDLVFAELGHHGIEARTLGRTDYPTSFPLREVLTLARHCSGGVILGFSQFEASVGTWKKGTPFELSVPENETALFSTPWNQLEAGILFALQIPLLVFRESRVAGGVFDNGVTDLFVHPTTERAELTQLRRETRQLKLEGDILSKAAAWFASRGLVCAGDRAEHDAIFGFMKANQATYPVRVMSRLLGVSASGFYAWANRPASARAVADISLTALIHAIHRRSGGAYGAPSIQAELADDHQRRVSTKRVARLMRAAGLRGLHPRRFVTTTIGDPVADRAVDQVDRQFAADGPDRLWVADITYVPTWAGFLYLAIVLDVWSRRIVGWAMEPHLKTELVLSALNMALAQRRPEAVIHHSDRGCQYTSYAFGKRCRAAGVMPSMGSTGDAYDCEPWPRASSPPWSAKC